MKTNESTHYKVQRNAGQAELGGRLSVFSFVFIGSFAHSLKISELPYGVNFHYRSVN